MIYSKNIELLNAMPIKTFSFKKIKKFDTKG